jgi:ABC-type multidrug transport system fused ATPase/permease subunit
LKRRYPILILTLAGLSLVSGMLCSGISLAGRLGVNLFYKEYRFFKIWWQGALVCFGLMLLVLVVLYFLDKKLKPVAGKLAMSLFFLVCLAGLYFTYKDFRTDLSHRLLGEKFHLGIYLYWVGFSIISLFFALTGSGKSANNITNQ